ncbi:hypothetical protein GR157_13535 [Burkholderia sp. 4701]|nr:hypothetical protein [Burkholderia sp. 4701]MXN86475.1 hypothetical protein [Burkholderia sp. 4812]
MQLDFARRRLSSPTVNRRDCKSACAQNREPQTGIGYNIIFERSCSMQCETQFSMLDRGLRQLSPLEVLSVSGAGSYDAANNAHLRSFSFGWSGSFLQGINSALDGAGRGALIGGTLGAALGPHVAALGAAAGAVYGAGLVVLTRGH